MTVILDRKTTKPDTALARTIPESLFPCSRFRIPLRDSISNDGTARAAGLKWMSISD